MDYYHFFQNLLKNADIELDGNRAWDIKVKALLLKSMELNQEATI